ncbi:EAL and HDOD domain-containing protein [Cellvibrio sp. PSBB006]|jgi:EAL and modified HD-GYP domain-containing signal transduction protein|uniref:EAL and HDOD domain-containing protein n=1 Tax=Cellvibrio sp. PSBB006 TaxID=1987723 RepID=UPI000B3BA1F9|nr:HDOD domain-containing protein [Cellvibrio sp. PSBB006]ARU26429.1 EAL domain-containing protein [Cellvibrio sp. PSBB006]
MSELLPLLARQPIFNRKMQVVAYELLCRSCDLNEYTADGGDMASSQVLLHTFTELSIHSVVGHHQAFINFTRTLLLTPPPFDRRQLVVEVLEGQQIDAQMLHSLRSLREQGYTIALDDFELTDETRDLIPYADIIKLDVLQLSPDQIREHIDYLKPFGLTLLAEKVETYEMLEYCKDAGFDLFQGYFLARPKVIKGRKITENKQAVLQLLSVLHDPDVPLEQVEQLVARDPMLSYKLLRLVNSAAFALPRTIESLRQAITLLGLNIIKNWVNLLAMANLGDKPMELSIAALTRARMCEIIAATMSGKKRQDTFFTVGLLSTLDAFMDAPLEILLSNISLSEQLNEALLQHLGDEGKVLDIVEHYERAEWDKIDWDYLGSRNISPDTLSHIYLDALTWVTTTMETMGFNPR